MIIDTHAQLNTRDAMEGITEQLVVGYAAAFSEMERIGLETSIKDMDAAGVEKSVLVAIDAETTFKYLVSNEMVAAAVRRYPERFIGFASVDPHKGTAAADELVDAVTRLGLKGLKIVPNLIEMYPNDRRLYPLYEIAREHDIPVLFHSGTLFYTGVRLKFGQPMSIDDVAVDFPQLKIIIAHFGLPWFYEAIAIVQRNPNVYFNISGWKPKYIPADVVRYMNGPLRHKVLFGSDYPLLSRVEILEELKQLKLKDDTLQMLLEGNAKAVLKLD
ncbi:MAG: amidohydrolase family protein [Desulfobacula sp.]|nr:amidohydrolase family protein [Desulfobacula sp.]